MMKIAAFYENIKLAVETLQISMEEGLKKLKEAGLDNIYGQYNVIQEDYEWLEPIMKKYDIGVEGVVAFLDLSHNPEEEVYKACIDFAVKVNAKNVLLLPGIILPEENEKSDELIQNMVDGLSKAVKYAEGTGVDVTLEDFDGVIAPYNSIAGMMHFLDNVEGLTCAFDTGNFIMYHEDPMEAFEAMRSKIVTVHVKDRSEQAVNPGDIPKAACDGAICYPCPVGRGFIPIVEMVEKLKSDGYDGGLIAELYDCDEPTLLEEIANSVKYLKALA